MANKKFTDLLPADALPNLTGTDILAVTVDPGGTPVSNKTTIANLMSLAPVQQSNIANMVETTDGIEALSNVSISNPADGSILKYVTANSQYEESTDYATAAQGTLASTALQSVSAGDLTDGNFDGEAILGFKASLPNEITAATYTVADSDNGQVLRVNHATGCTVTIPSGLLSTDSTGFNCSFIQVGAGQITFANDGTSTINNRQSHTKTNAQWAAASVVSTANNVFVLAGDTAA